MSQLKSVGHVFACVRAKLMMSYSFNMTRTGQGKVIAIPVAADEASLIILTNDHDFKHEQQHDSELTC